MFITGSSRGLGRNIALTLARSGADVVITYRSGKQEGEAVVAEIQALGRKAVALQLDTSLTGYLRNSVAILVPGSHLIARPKERGVRTPGATSSLLARIRGQASRFPVTFCSSRATTSVLMITSPPMFSPAPSDADLVQRSLREGSDAFSEIVARYQNLICSLTYNATGSLSRSEDLAQEVFLTAWQDLTELREPEKLRAWLCGIARRLTANVRRREEREPVAGAAELIDEHRAPGPGPVEQAISREEEALLWRSLAQIPNNYREPIILFYREGQSVEGVAAALELSEDAVKQRLSRGRKLLQEQVALFVEGALRQSTPGRAFTLGVIAALPLMTASASAATLGTAAAKGGVTLASLGALGLFSAILGPVVGVLGAWVGVKASLDSAVSEKEREMIRYHTRWMIVFILLFTGFMVGAIHSSGASGKMKSWLPWC